VRVYVAVVPCETPSVVTVMVCTSMGVRAGGSMAICLFLFLWGSSASSEAAGPITTIEVGPSGLGLRLGLAVAVAGTYVQTETELVVVDVFVDVLVLEHAGSVRKLQKVLVLRYIVRVKYVETVSSEGLSHTSVVCVMISTLYVSVTTRSIGALRVSRFVELSLKGAGSHQGIVVGARVVVLRRKLTPEGIGPHRVVVVKHVGRRVFQV